MKIKRLFHGGRVTETKQIERNGIPVGIVSGYIATWDTDRGDWSGIKDKFLPGAFKESLLRHKKTNRQIRLKDHHGRTVGGFPIDTVKEDERGLFGIGEINLDVQQGAEVFALAKQGVLSDFSIGWGLVEAEIVEGIREIATAEVFEGSVVDEPMNPEANILEVKTIDSADLVDINERDLENMLKSGVQFSAKSAKQLISALKKVGMLRDEQDDNRDGLKNLESIADSILTKMEHSNG